MSEEGLRHVEESTWPLIALIAIVSFGMVACYSEWPWKESPWQATSAIATFLAVVVSLVFSMKSQSRDKENEIAVGRNVAARISVSLWGLLKEILEADKAMIKARDNYSSNKNLSRQLVEEVERIVGSLTLRVSGDELVALSRVDSGLAESVSLAVGCLERLRDKDLFRPQDEDLLLTKENFYLVGSYIQTARFYIKDARNKSGSIKTLDFKRSRQWGEWHKEINIEKEKKKAASDLASSESPSEPSLPH